jgi:tetratricopeptide (TPR) repeat protein
MRLCGLVVGILLSTASIGASGPAAPADGEGAALLTQAVEAVAGARLPDAEVALERAGRLYEARDSQLSDPERSHYVNVLNLRASILDARGELAAAEGLYRRALDTAKGGRSTIDVTDSLVLLSGVLANRGQLGAADRLASRALALAEKTWGRDHPEVARALNARADVRLARGEMDEAERFLRRAARLAEGPGGTPAMQAAVAVRRGLVRLRTGRLPEAEPMLERSLDLAETALGADHLALVQVMQALADCYRLRNRPRDAQELYESAIERVERAYGPTHPSLLPHLAGLAMVLERQDELPRAEAMYRRASTIAADLPVRGTYVALRLGFEARHRGGVRAAAAGAP